MGGTACRYFNVSRSVVLYQPSDSQHFCCFQARIEEQLEDRERKVEALIMLLEEQKREAQRKVECVAVVHRGKHFTEVDTESYCYFCTNTPAMIIQSPVCVRLAEAERHMTKLTSLAFSKAFGVTATVVVLHRHRHLSSRSTQ